MRHLPVFFDLNGARVLLVGSGPMALAQHLLHWWKRPKANASAHASARHEQTGSVSLVGAGPGDPDLLTLKALQELQTADVIFHDDLVPQAIIDRARGDAEVHAIGRRKGKPGIGQDAVIERMIAAAREGKRVVRLKGGDPMIFGRGGEEVEALRDAGIDVSVVPGITAALGGTAEWELPLTYRNVASRVIFLTAHRALEEAALGRQELRNPETTLVIYMGLSSADEIRSGLLAAGRDPSTPAAVLTRATWEDSQAVAGVLDQLPRLAGEAGEGPGLIVVGDVVRHSKIWPQAAYVSETDLRAHRIRVAA
jgi:uroporphyrin-III C-methyltransferase/precorrin-2 dehydrogenase/sirohydrochlorin ferrochelatase